MGTCPRWNITEGYYVLGPLGLKPSRGVSDFTQHRYLDTPAVKSVKRSYLGNRSFHHGTMGSYECSIIFAGKSGSAKSSCVWQGQWFLMVIHGYTNIYIYGDHILHSHVTIHIYIYITIYGWRICPAHPQDWRRRPTTCGAEFKWPWHWICALDRDSLSGRARFGITLMITLMIWWGWTGG